MSEKGLQILGKKSLISQVKGVTYSSCEICLYEKHHRVSFKRASERKNNTLDLVYSDVCGLFDSESLDGNKYFATFIDDASRKV